MLCNYRQADDPGRPGEEFPGLDHGASSDPSQTNPGGKPEIVAQIAAEVRSFFAINTHQESQ